MSYSSSWCLGLGTATKMAIRSVYSNRQATIKRSISSNREMTMEEFKQWLKGFDTDGDGRISKAELREAIRSMGGWFTTWKSGRGIRSADSNCNGYVEDNEINNLLEFAQKKMGLKIVAY